MLKHKKSKCFKFICIFFIFNTLFISGCNLRENGITINGVTFCITNGLEKSAVMRSGSYELSKGQCKALMNIVCYGYTEVFTSDVWETRLNNIEFTQVVSDLVKDIAARIILVNLLADDKGISLSPEQENDVENKILVLYDKGIINIEDIELDEARALIRMIILSDKVYSELTQKVNTQVSLDEARVVEVQYIFSKDSIKKLENSKMDIESGMDFLAVATKYSDSNEYIAEFGRGELALEFEEAVFNLNKGEVSDIISCDNGYYIVKCINDNVKDRAQAQKTKIIDKRKKEQFLSYLKDFSRDVSIYFDEIMWNKIYNEVSKLQ